MLLKERIIVVNELKKGGVNSYINSLECDDDNLLDLSKTTRFNISFFKIIKAIYLVLKVKPKVLICVEDLPSLVGLFYNHSKVVINIHRNPDVNYSTKKGKIFAFIYKYLFTSNVRFVGVSKYQSISLERIIKKPVEFRYTILPEKENKNISFKPKFLTFIIASRLEPDKGINEGINYYLSLKKILNSKNIKTELKIYGSFACQKFKNTILTEIVDDCSIIYAGAFSNIEELVTNISPVYLNFSKHEGFGLVNWEMIEYGIPSVIYNCNYGPSELINENYRNSNLGPKLINSFHLKEDEIIFFQSLALIEGFYKLSSLNSLKCSKEFRTKILKKENNDPLNLTV